MKRLPTDAPFWTFLASVVLGPFIPLAAVPLGMLFEHTNSEPIVHALMAMLFIGIPVWFTSIVASASWLGHCIDRANERQKNRGISGSLAAWGILASVIIAVLACAVS